MQCDQLCTLTGGLVISRKYTHSYSYSAVFVGGEAAPEEFSGCSLFSFWRRYLVCSSFMF